MRAIQLIGFIVALLASAIVARAESMDNPDYESWAKCKPGTKVVLKSDSNGKSTVVTVTLIEVKPDKCITEMSSEVRGKPYKVNRDIEKTVTDPDAIKKYKEQTAHGTDESVTTPAGTFKCRHYSFKTEDGSTMEVWTCDDVPGMDVKSIQDVPTLKTKRTMELQSIDKK